MDTSIPQQVQPQTAFQPALQPQLGLIQQPTLQPQPILTPITPPRSYLSVGLMTFIIVVVGGAIASYYIYPDYYRKLLKLDPIVVRANNVDAPDAPIVPVTTTPEITPATAETPPAQQEAKSNESTESLYKASLFLPSLSPSAPEEASKEAPKKIRRKRT